MAKISKKIKINKKSKTTEKTSVGRGRVYVTATFNNTLVNVTDDKGNTLAWATAGGSGFKGSRKSTPFAAITAVENVAQKVKEMGVTSVEVYIKGPGSGRDASIKALKNAGINITMIADITPMPHNGPRPKKRRRV